MNKNEPNSMQSQKPISYVFTRIRRSSCGGSTSATAPSRRSLSRLSWVSGRRAGRGRSGFVAGALVALLAITGCSGRSSYDLIIRGGRVLDGSGNPWYYADIGVRGDRIAAVGDLSTARAARIVDAGGLYVAPGFVDVHTHVGSGLDTPDRSAGHPLLAQGITTVLVNPDGGGPVDLAQQRRDLLEDGLGVNVGMQIGHNVIRSRVIGSEDRDPTPAELDSMKLLVRAGMEEGAFGLSSAPFYSPGSFSKTEEIVALAAVAAEFGGTHQSHVRDESDYTIGLLDAVEEVITVSRETGVRGIVTHIKALGPHVWGYSEAVVERIKAARAEGLEIFADQYPYEASSTGLSAALLPRWAQAGGPRALRARLDDPETIARIRSAIVENLDRRGGASRIQFRRFEPDSTIEGRTLQMVADDMGLRAVDAAVALFKKGSPSIVSFNMNEDDIRTFMRQTWTMTASDGSLPRMNIGVPHPRAYGTFPRKIRKYAVEEGVVDLSFAIRSMTSLPVTVFRIPDRGSIRPGAFADLVVFDLNRLRDTAIYSAPHQLAEGMVHVLVNGRFAIRDGAFTGDLAGRVLSRR